MDHPIYLDYNATTPIDKEVALAMRPFLDQFFGNPSSIHRYGLEARKAIEHARVQVAQLLECQPEEIVFTSGGSESNNMAIKGIAGALRQKGNHIITSAIEHPAVKEVCHYLATQGCEITFLPVDQYGMVDPGVLARAIRPLTILVTIMHANNEVGTIQPIAELAEICRHHGIVFHTDAAQSVGKIPVNVNAMGADLLSLAGHKFYAPKGVGALYIRAGIVIDKLIHGADHENNRRAGTENLLEIVGLGQAAEIASRDLTQNMKNMGKMRDRLQEGLVSSIADSRINGHPNLRLPNTLSISFAGLDASTLLSQLSSIAASAGAACHVGDASVSSVLQAMKTPVEYAMGAIRFSTGKYTTQQEIDKAVELVSEGVRKLTFLKGPAMAERNLQGRIKLTHYTHGLGCACKLRPQELEALLQTLPVPVDPNILVDARTNDDAAVYKLSEQLALVQTVDFFTPVVDDPYAFGAIAAANALSDIYAMGGTPRFALNIVGFPSKRLPMSVLEQILKGAQDKANEAEVSILGGHSIEDTEPKFGMVVTGFVRPDKLLTNSTAKVGDALILTKPIGLGILTTALKREMLPRPVEEQIMDLMGELNRNACKIMLSYPVSACTDITGFGLMGHLKEMAEASQMDVELISSRVPVIEEAREMARLNMIPGGTWSNLEFVDSVATWDPGIPEITRLILCDAQTSGGLLISVPSTYSKQLVDQLHSEGITHAAIIGYAVSEGKGKIIVNT